MKKEEKKQNIKIIMGLGNEGEEYSNTYHNLGQIFVNNLSSTKWKKISKKHFLYSENDGFLFVKSNGYMNESGIAAKEALSYFNLDTNNFLVAHDDSDFIWGSYKIAFGQSSAGHKGVESIIKELGTKDFWRLRIGARIKEEISENFKHRRTKAKDFVLKNIPKKDFGELKILFSEIENEIKGL